MLDVRLYIPRVTFLVFVGCLWFCTVLYCVCAFECSVYVGMFEGLVSFLICGLWYVKVAHFLFSSLSCFWWIFFVAFVFSGLLRVSPGNCCFVPWLVLFSIQIVVFLLLVAAIAFR